MGEPTAERTRRARRARPRSGDDRRALVEPLLAPDEQLLWVGYSDPRKMFGSHDRWLVPLSILFTGFVVAVLVRGAVEGIPLPAAVVLLVFLLIGAHGMVGRFLVKRHRKRTEVYAVTDRRALVTDGRHTRDVDVRRTDRMVDDSGDHLSIEWNETGDLDTLFLGGSSAVRQYANTGLDGILGMRRDFAFYDVTDGDGLASALEQAVDR
ncbi:MULTISPECIES: hypothetical protein [unclassified Curtobacterium]|uniref:hypothetical protein n=1 Tax=unclassified Curtobacterium TaxID=257496 RepID=UPI0008DE2E40|nr:MULTISPECIES: hypothetical protein [unclassified Curtobacterium]OIH94159.1 hypothetical protein BIU92_06920 [Curtobacterium sp. MCBA15_003]OII29344.1 hypothetical protein BIU94_13075 [Curtobacterium sp. MMLR14_006]